MKIANHRPLFDIEKVCEKYEEDGTPIRYICTTDLNASDVPVDVFYRGKKPHPRFGNRYFGLFFDHYRGHSMICNADMVEDLEFGMIEHEGEYYYSQSHHDFVKIGDKVIDGGRVYARGNGFVMMKLKDGEFYVEDDNQSLPRTEAETSTES